MALFPISSNKKFKLVTNDKNLSEIVVGRSINTSDLLILGNVSHFRITT